MIIFNQVFNESDLKYVYSPKFDIAENDEVQKFIDSEWNELVASTKARGGELWDGEIYRIGDINANAGKLEISLGKATYRNIRAFKKHKDKLQKLDRAFHPRGGVVSAIVKTKDDLFVNGQLPESSSLDAKINVVGGSMNISELEFNQNFSIFDFIKNEIDEELGVKSDLIEEVKLIGVFQTENMQIVFLFMVVLSVDSNEVKRLHSALVSKEFESLLFSDLDELKVIFKNMGSWKLEIHLLKGFNDFINKTRENE